MSEEREIDEMRLKHFTPHGSDKCACGRFLSVFTEGTGLCVDAVEDFFNWHNRQISELKAEVDNFRTLSVIEIMTRNVNVNSWVNEKEKEIEQLRNVIKELGGVLEFYSSGFYKTGYDGCVQPSGSLKEDQGALAAKALSNPIVKEIMESER